MTPSQMLQKIGVRAQVAESSGVVHYRLLVPTAEGRIVVEARAFGGEVGAGLVRRLKKRAKAAYKWAAKSRASKMLAQVAPTIAPMLGPAGPVLLQAAAGLRGAQNVDRWSRGDFSQEKLAARIMSGDQSALMSGAKSMASDVLKKASSAKTQVRVIRQKRKKPGQKSLQKSAEKQTGVVVVTRSGRKARVVFL